MADAGIGQAAQQARAQGQCDSPKRGDDASAVASRAERPGKRNCGGNRWWAEEREQEEAGVQQWWVVKSAAARRRSRKAVADKRARLTAGLMRANQGRARGLVKEGALAAQAAELERVGRDSVSGRFFEPGKDMATYEAERIAWLAGDKVRVAAWGRAKELREEGWEIGEGAQTWVEAAKVRAGWEAFREVGVFSVDLADAIGAGVGVRASRKVVFSSGGSNVLGISGICVSGQRAYDPSSTER